MSQYPACAVAKGGRLKLLHRLKQLAPVSADRLARELGISSQAVRQQLAALTADGLVEATRSKGQGPGRPQALWQVTSAAAGYFADAYQEFLVELLELLAAHHGAGELEQLLAGRTARQLDSYRAQISAVTLSARLEQLAQLRARDGYMAEVQPQNGELMLIEHHCPLQSVAHRHRALCDEEQRLFENLLGEGIGVERCEHVLKGAKRCSYRIVAGAGSAKEAGAEGRDTGLRQT
jgi:predicted ArsR family transcriptional regulator